MSRRSGIWLLIVWLFALVNLGGAVYAARMHEWPHAGLHVVGLLVCGALSLWLMQIRARTAAAVAGDAPAVALPAGYASPALAERLTSLERSIDVVAVEVERVGEGQRFMTRMFGDAPPRGPGDPAA